MSQKRPEIPPFLTPENANGWYDSPLPRQIFALRTLDFDPFRVILPRFSPSETSPLPRSRGKGQLTFHPKVS